MTQTTTLSTNPVTMEVPVANTMSIQPRSGMVPSRPCTVTGPPLMLSHTLRPRVLPQTASTQRIPSYTCGGSSPRCYDTWNAAPLMSLTMPSRSSMTPSPPLHYISNSSFPLIRVVFSFIISILRSSA